MNSLFATAAIVILTAISTQAKAGGIYSNVFPERFDTMTIDFPSLGTTAEVDVGDSIISRVLKGKKPAIQLTSELKGLSVKLAFFRYNIKFSSTLLTLYSTTKEGAFYVDENSFVENTSTGTMGGILIPNASESPVEICYVSIGTANCDPLPTLIEGSGFKRTEVDFLVKASFKRELVFTGGSSKAINLIYREYQNDFARPAFSQDLKFDISEDNVVGFKGARFRIIKAGNTGITYEVLKHLN